MVCFIGDEILHRAGFLTNFRYFGVGSIDFHRADTLTSLWEVVNAGKVCPQNYTTVVINVGINNVLELTPQSALRNMEASVHSLKVRNPSLRVFVASILPRPRDDHWSHYNIICINKLWHSFSAPHFSFLPTYKAFLENGRPMLEMFAPNLFHLSHLGAASLLNVISEAVVNNNVAE